MSCTSCYQAKNLPRCINTIAIGTITDINTDVIVRMKSSAGRIDYLEATSDGTGDIVLDVTGFPFAEMQYEFSVLKASDRSQLTVTTADAEETECIEMGFEMGTAVGVSVVAR